ncbi:MAG: MBL fold metallo-hydrolase, partial [Pseudomonadota bacterium]
MSLDLITIPCLSDNYAFLAHDAASGETALFDVPEAGPILAELEARGWRLTQIFLTHHHWDHVGGLNEVLAVHKAQVIGAAADAGRLPPLDHTLAEADSVSIGTVEGTVIDVSGHTVNHIAYHFPAAKLLVT